MPTCKLCRRESDKLINSHLIPKAAYRVLLSNGTDALIRVESGHKRAAYNNMQTKAELLCSDCEDLFSKNGERVLGNLWATSQGFPLLEMLKKLTPIAKDAFTASQLPSDISDAIRYFAVSVVWRSNVWPPLKNHLDNNHRGTLGDLYELNFRNYLLGCSRLENVYFYVNVNNSIVEGLNGLFSFPHHKKYSGIGHVHYFQICGIEFFVIVGKLVPPYEVMFSAINSNMVLKLSDFSSSGNAFYLSDLVNNRIRPVGRLALGI